MTQQDSKFKVKHIFCAVEILMILTLLINKFLPPQIITIISLICAAMYCLYAQLIKSKKSNGEVVSTYEPKIRSLIYQFSFSALSILTIAILFRIQHYPGANIMFQVSGLILVPAFIYFAAKTIKKSNEATLEPISEPEANLLEKIKKVRFSELEMVIRILILFLLAWKCIADNPILETTLEN